MRKIIFGGAFDPIHLGHIKMASAASEQLDADVIFVPAVISVWKDTSVSFNQKVEMINLLIKDYPRFSLSLYESTTNKEKNYSIDTVKHFKKEYPNDELYLLIGGDQVRDFHLWKNADEIADLIQIVYYSREDFDDNHENITKYHMREIKGEDIYVSSSDFKSMKANDYLPYSLVEYITTNDLYMLEAIKGRLSKNRYEHSKQVALLAFRIALSNNMEHPLKAFYAGLLHDIGKEVEKEKSKELMNTHFSEYADLPAFSYHQFIGSYIAKEEFGMGEDVVEAIKYHATGNYPMSRLAKIIYAADKIEPTRGFDSTDLINSCLQNDEEGFVIVLQANKEFLEGNRKDINNRLTKKCFDNYLSHK